jgi:hypothetical protein
MKFSAAYPAGRVNVLKVIPNGNDRQIITVYDQGASCLVEIFSVNALGKLIEIDVGEKVFDIIPHGASLHCTLLMIGKLGHYIPHVPEESFGELYSTAPEFHEWFSRDSNSSFFKPAKINEIVVRRKELENELMFDKLLKLIDEDAPLSYPPRDAHQLESLFRMIADCQQESNFKNCMIYYLLKDNNLTKATSFGTLNGLSRPFLLAMDGFWCLDKGLYGEAVRYLSDPAVNLDDPPGLFMNWHVKILTSLYEKEQYQDACIFIQSKQVSYWSQDTIHIVLKILAKTNLFQALSYRRRYCRYDHQRSLSIIFDECFFGIFLKILLVGAEKILKSHDLLTVLLNDDEQEYLIDYCHQSEDIFVCDFLLNFFIQKGRYGEAVKAYAELFRNRGLPVDARRHNRMNNVSLLLPPIQAKAMGIIMPVNVVLTAQSPKVAPAAEEAVPEQSLNVLSQDLLIRDGKLSEENVIKALRLNYLKESEPVLTESPNSNPLGLDTEDVDMESTYETLHKPLQSSHTTPGSQIASITKKSPAPFVQPPYTPKIDQS